MRSDRRSDSYFALVTDVCAFQLTGLIDLITQGSEFTRYRLLPHSYGCELKLILQIEQGLEWKLFMVSTQAHILRGM